LSEKAPQAVMYVHSFSISLAANHDKCHKHIHKHNICSIKLCALSQRAEPAKAFSWFRINNSQSNKETL